MKPIDGPPRIEIMMQLARTISTTAIAVTVIAGSILSAHAEGMTAVDIRRDIVGHRIYLAAPVGGEFPLRYRPDGLVDGDGTALGLGRYLSPAETGRWWIDGDRLCQQFKTWYNGDRSCFKLAKVGPGSVKWVRDNGETGIARIGD